MLRRATMITGCRRRGLVRHHPTSSISTSHQHARTRSKLAEISLLRPSTRHSAASDTLASRHHHHGSPLSSATLPMPVAWPPKHYPPLYMHLAPRLNATGVMTSGELDTSCSVPALHRSSPSMLSPPSPSLSVKWDQPVMLFIITLFPSVSRSSLLCGPMATMCQWCPSPTP